MKRVAAALALLALTGCGGDRGEITDTVQSFYDAAVDGASVEVADFPIEFQLERTADGWRISSFGDL